MDHHLSPPLSEHIFETLLQGWLAVDHISEVRLTTEFVYTLSNFVTCCIAKTYEGRREAKRCVIEDGRVR